MRFCQQTRVREPFSAGQQQPCPWLLNSMRCFRPGLQQILPNGKKDKPALKKSTRQSPWHSYFPFHQKP